MRDAGEVVQRRRRAARRRARGSSCASAAGASLRRSSAAITARRVGERARRVARGLAQVPRRVVGAALRDTRSRRALARPPARSAAYFCSSVYMRIASASLPASNSACAVAKPGRLESRRDACRRAGTTRAHRRACRACDARRRSARAARDRSGALAAICSSASIALAHLPIAPYAVARSALISRSSGARDRDRLELADQPRRVAARRVDQHEHAARRQVIGHARGDLLELLLGSLRVAELPQRRAELIARLEIPRPPRDELLEQVERDLVLAGARHRERRRAQRRRCRRARGRPRS